MPNNETDPGRSKLSRLADILLKIAAFFIILEPIWMLLPFAGFLYGSVMHIQMLSSNPKLSWLVYFVLPTHTLFPVGIILVVVGFMIFLIGASQIYYAKLFKKGMVTKGIYRFFRHPQYVSLSIFCIGIILTWGRFITYIAFFVMLWLYYYLSKSEERQCQAAFGAEYDAYKKTVWFLFPGEGLLFKLWAGVPKPKLPKSAAIAVSGILVISFAIASGFFIQWVRAETRQTIPCIQAKKTFTGSSAEVDLIMVKGPAMQAAPFEAGRTEFMDKQFQALMASAKINKLLGYLGLGEKDTVLVFLTPGKNWHDQMGRHDSNKVDLFILVLNTPVKYNGANFSQFRRAWAIRKAVFVDDFSYQAFKEGKDPAQGEMTIPGPPRGEFPEFLRVKFEERVDFFLSGL
ncbi:MAG: isoprenylcysteine carboxylmethyltransferase family protein [Planctomycetes bacterium]|nr:isoprenylcysteine carboxylmethyltransferase family protein [Planctomycetota bacterium]